MTERLTAILNLLQEAQRERLTKVGLKRVRASARTLELTAEETEDLEYHLDYRDPRMELLKQFRSTEKTQ